MNSEDLVIELRNTIDLIGRDGTTVLDERSIPVLEAAIKEVKEPCEDCIDREALMDIEYEDVIDVHGKQYVRLMEVADKTIKMPTVRPLSSTDDCEPCDDCISRQYLIEKAVSWDKHFADGIRYVALTDILNAPSVTPTQKMGHWIDTGSGQECSECGEIQYGYDNFRHFCANCGSRMEVDDATSN